VNALSLSLLALLPAFLPSCIHSFSLFLALASSVTHPSAPIVALSPPFSFSLSLSLADAPAFCQSLFTKQMRKKRWSFPVGISVSRLREREK